MEVSGFIRFHAGKLTCGGRIIRRTRVPRLAQPHADAKPELRALVDTLDAMDHRQQVLDEAGTAQPSDRNQFQEDLKS